MRRLAAETFAGRPEAVKTSLEELKGKMRTTRDLMRKELETKNSV
jgi:HAMP domain-containing protein